MLARFAALALLSLFALAAPSAAQAAPGVAVFDFVLINSSLEADTPAEIERLGRLTESLKQALAKSGQYEIVELAPLKEKIAAVRDRHGCNNCEVDLAREAGAQLVVVAWVQKVSNLILNINLRIVDVETGKALKGGSVDIRDNSDVSWDRGLKFLLESHVFNDAH